MIPYSLLEMHLPFFLFFHLLSVSLSLCLSLTLFSFFFSQRISYFGATHATTVLRSDLPRRRHVALTIIYRYALQCSAHIYSEVFNLLLLVSSDTLKYTYIYILYAIGYMNGNAICLRSIRVFPRSAERKINNAASR